MPNLKSVLALLIGLSCIVPNYSFSETTFVPPSSPHCDLRFNAGWKFFKGDLGLKSGVTEIAFDDSKWADVSAPHTFNDADSYQKIISHSSGDRGAWSGIVWYRKHFKLPAGAKDGKVFLEFEGMK